MKMKSSLCVFGVLAIIFLFYCHGWTQSRPDSKAPMLTSTFAVEKGYYGYIWKIYIEAEDPDGDMYKIVSAVEQPGEENYFPDWLIVKPQYRKHLKGYLQWNTFSPRTSGLSEWTRIKLTVSVWDKAGNESNRVIFPFTFESGVVPKYELPDPFSQADPRLGYIHIELDDSTRHDGRAGELRLMEIR